MPGRLPPCDLDSASRTGAIFRVGVAAALVRLQGAKTLSSRLEIMSSAPFLRIAQVICSDSFAGVEHYVANVSASLAARGHSVTVIGGQGAAMRRALSPEAVSHVPAATIRQAVAGLLHQGRSGARPDLVHAHMVEAEIAAVMTKPVIGPRIVATLHFACPRGRTVRRQHVLAWLPKAIDRQIAISEFVARESRLECEVIPPGVPANGTAPDAASAGQRRRSVLVAQRFEKEKETGTALQIWALSGLAQEGWTLELAGSGSEEVELRAMAAELGIAASVRFLGFVDDLPVRMRAAAVLLATAPREPFGLSVVEAMAARLPVVAARGGGHIETLGEVDDALYGAGDVWEGAKTLRTLALDRPERERYGEALFRRYLESYTMAAHTSRLEDVYRELLREGRHLYGR
jgi:glycosyltransferase involved in cell wall biosynthesis